MIKKFLLSRLKEASTWRGIILLVAGCVGYQLNTEQQAVLVTLALAAVGAIGSFVPDKIATGQASTAASSPGPVTSLPESPSE